MGFPCGSEGKESDSNVGDPGLIPGWGRPPGEGHGCPLQYSSWRIPMDRGAWWATVRGVAKRQTRLSDAAQHKLQRKQKQNPLTDPGICSVCASLVFFIF